MISRSILSVAALAAVSFCGDIGSRSLGLPTASAFVPSQPLLGSRVLLAYLDSKDGGRIRRYVPEAWSGFHV